MSIEPDPNHEHDVRVPERIPTREEVLAAARPFDWDAWQAFGDELTEEEAERFRAAILDA